MSRISAPRPVDGFVPDYLIVGHVTRDIVGDGHVIGGTVTYAGLTAVALGRRVAAVTSAGDDFDVGRALPSIQFQVRRAPATTTFENVYHGGHRQQWIRAVAAPLDHSLIPEGWRHAPIVHLAPLAREFGAEMITAFSGYGLLGLTPQGWLRRWNADGFVERCSWEHPEEVLKVCDAVVLSEEDVDGDWELLRGYAGVARLLVVTQGARGCTVFQRGRAWQVAAFPATEVDATGAGDVFAAAFFTHLLDHGDPVQAAHYANCVASFAVEALGTAGIPTREAIARRLAAHPLSLTVIQ
ncbi:MAG: ribokinase [Chloroflexi bacterium]|nr:ribokinase [Chloroflexota bacterium]